MTLEEIDERMNQVMELMEGVPAILIDADVTDTEIRMRWNPLFIHYRNALQKMGLLKELDEIEFACLVLSSADKLVDNQMNN